MSVWINCPECGDVGPHTVIDEEWDVVIAVCVNDWCGVEFEIPAEELAS